MVINKNIIKIIYSVIGIDMIYLKKWKWIEELIYLFIKIEIK